MGHLHTEYPSCYDQHCSAFEWEIVVILAGRLSVPDLCRLRILYRLCQADLLAGTIRFINHVPLCDPLSKHGHVLLVAAGPDQPPAVVCVRGAVHH